MAAEGPVEVDEGVLLERREVLRISLGALALLSLGWPQRALAEEPAAGDDAAVTWDAFVRQAVPLAENLVASRKPDEEAYLARLSTLMRHLRVPPGVGALRAKKPIVAAQFRMLPGRGFPWHDHRDYNGLLLCVAGEARVRSAEVVGPNPRPPRGVTFQIRQTSDVRMTAGCLASLTRTRDNLHDVRGAGRDGARLLDLFTVFDERWRSVNLSVAPRPKDAARRIYDAMWSA
jgi:hypothetical protein